MRSQKVDFGKESLLLTTFQDKTHKLVRKIRYTVCHCFTLPIWRTCQFYFKIILHALTPAAISTSRDLRGICSPGRHYHFKTQTAFLLLAIEWLPAWFQTSAMTQSADALWLVERTQDKWRKRDALVYWERERERLLSKVEMSSRLANDGEHSANDEYQNVIRGASFTFR